MGQVKSSLILMKLILETHKEESQLTKLGLQKGIIIAKIEPGMSQIFKYEKH